MKKFNQYWPVTQFAGKDQVRQQAAMWQAMLLSANLPHSKQIVIHGFLTVDGQKISKSLGNTIDPIAVAEEYGTDALRYYLLAKLHPAEDSDFSWEKFKLSYNADLANGLGNLIARVAKLCENADYTHMGSPTKNNEHLVDDSAYKQALDGFKYNEATTFVWQKISALDKFINDEKPWVLAKTNTQQLKSVLAHCVDQIQEISILLEPFLPETAQKISEQFKGPKIVPQPSLFPRL